MISLSDSARTPCRVRYGIALSANGSRLYRREVTEKRVAVSRTVSESCVGLFYLVLMIVMSCRFINTRTATGVPFRKRLAPSTRVQRCRMALSRILSGRTNRLDRLRQCDVVSDGSCISPI